VVDGVIRNICDATTASSIKTRIDHVLFLLLYAAGVVLPLAGDDDDNDNDDDDDDDDDDNDNDNELMADSPSADPDLRRIKLPNHLCGLLSRAELDDDVCAEIEVEV
jgi:hypothetical protein